MVRKTKAEAAITRNSLLEAALTVFSRKGYVSSTLEDVARQAGVTRGAIYWHFGSKAELYNALADSFGARSSQIVQAAAAEGGSLVEILRRIFIRQMEAVEHDLELRKMMEISLFKTERTPELLASQQQRIESSRGLLESIAQAMQKGISAGELRSDMDPMEMSRAFLALQNGAIHLWLHDPQAFSLSASAPSLIAIYLEGITR